MHPNMPPTMPMQPPGHRSHRWLISFIITLVLLLVTIIFAVWAYLGMLDYKQNVDEKIADAATRVKQETATQKDKEFTEKEKNPLKRYAGPATYGSVVFDYPKTWSAYVDQNNAGIPLNGYFHPDVVPGVQSKTAFALRVQVINQSYDAQLRQLDSKVKAGKVKLSPYSAPKVSSVLGSRAEGEINTGQTNTKIILPVRDKTLEISTEAEQYVGDLDKFILSSLTFSP